MNDNDQCHVRRRRELRESAYVLACAALGLAGLPTWALADSARFDIAAQPLSQGLRSFATQAHMQVLYASSLVQDRHASEVHGSFEKHDALTMLLHGTGLKAVYTSADAATIVSAVGATSRAAPQHPATINRDPPAASSASAPASTSPDTLQVIVVTAEKRKEPLQTVPVPVSVLPAPSLAKQNQFRIQDYAAQVPGLSVTPNDFNGSATVAIRGVTSGDTANPTVAATIDDVSIGSSTSIGNGFNIPDLDPSDLASIEVLRGPQGTLYGANSIGGLVKYVTADPSTHALTGDVRVGTDAVHAGGSAGYDFSAGGNVPLTDTWAIRGSLSSREDPGYIADVQYGRQSHVNRTRNYGGHLASLWRPSGAFSLKLDALYQQSKLDGAPYVTLVPGVGDLQQTFLPYTGTVDRKFGALIAVATARLGIFDLTSVTGYTVTRYVDFLDYSQSEGQLTAILFNTPYTLDTDDVTTRKESEELRLSTRIGTHVDWLVGGYFTHEFSPYFLQTLGADPAGNPTALAQLAVFSSVYQELAEFTDLTYHFTGKFDVQIGGRTSQIMQTYQNEQTGPLNALLGGAFDFPEHEIHQHAFTYLLTPRLRVTPTLMVYGRIASGFRPGGINPEILASIPRDFKPDTTVNYELGVKGDFLDRRLSLDGSLYYIDWRSIQLSLLDPVTGAPYLTNGGGAKSEGVELSVSAVPVNGLRLAGWVSYDNAVLTKSMPPASSAYGNAGDRLPYSSRLSANASADYEFPLGMLTGSFGATVSYVGDRLGGFVSNLPGVVPERQDFPAYTAVNFRSALNGDLWSLELYVNNLADRRGIIGGGIGSQTPTAFELIQPRTIGISVTRRFQ